MNKLQLYITKTYDGFQNMLEINQDDAIKQQIVDLSPAMEDISYDTERINIFYLLKYTDQGVFVVIMRSIPPRAVDHLAAWIFVPTTISVSENDMHNVVDTIVNIISNSKITSEQFNELRKLFSKEYETVMTPAATIANAGSQYAHRYFGADSGYELQDFLGSKKYQTSNLPFAGVILATKADAPQITGPDLTDEPLEQMVKIFPPKLVSNLYQPIIFGLPFDKPFLVPLMGTVEILWKSDKAVDVRQSIMISKPNMRPDPIAASVIPTPKPVVEPGAPSVPTAQEKPADTEKVSQPSTAPSPTEPATDTKPKDLKPKAQEAQKQPATDAEAKNTNETKEAEQPADTQHDPRILNYDRQHHYNFEIPAKSADISGVIKFELNTRNELKGSPIDGYELSGPIQEGTGRSNYLVYTPVGSRNLQIIYAAAGFVIGILLTLLCTCAFGSPKTDESNDAENDSISQIEAVPDTMTTESGVKVPVKPAITDTSLEAAINYLDTNQSWDKSVLESYPDLKGLYNDMNTFDKKRLVEHWGTKLKDSRRFASVAKHAKLGMKKAPRTAKSGQKTFNTPSEQTIKIQSYLNTIDP